MFLSVCVFGGGGVGRASEFWSRICRTLYRTAVVLFECDATM